MSYECLAEFLEELAQSDDLVRVGASVDASEELAAIASQVVVDKGFATLFSRLDDCEFPVVANLLGTPRRIALALAGRSPGDLADQISALLRPTGSEGWLDRMVAAPWRDSLCKFTPKRVKTGACQQVVRLGEDVDLTGLPSVKTFADEGRGWLNAAQVLVRSPDGSQVFLGRCDVRVADRSQLALRWHGFDEPTRLLKRWAEHGEPMPVAVMLGGDPAGVMASMTPLGRDIDPLAFSGFLRDKPRQVVKCKRCDLAVPVDVEMVIEGHVSPTDPKIHGGRLLSPCRSWEETTQCVDTPMTVTAVTHRPNPVIPVMLHTSGKNEFVRITQAMAELTRPLLRLNVPDVVDYRLPSAGSARHIAFVSLDKSHAGQTRATAGMLWGQSLFRFVKLMVIVDRDTDVHDDRAVWQAVAAHCDMARDLFTSEGTADPWDPSGRSRGFMQRTVIDATRKPMPEDEAVGPAPVDVSEPTQRKIIERWNEYGLAEIAGPGDNE